MGRFPMIVISTYNPERERTTEDELLLTTMLTSLISYRSRMLFNQLQSGDDLQKTYFEQEKKNCNSLIRTIYPLLGLDFGEVSDLIQGDFNQWLTDHSGRK